MATNFYDHPSKKLNLIGITGTNGKTTSTTLLFNLYRKLGFHCGLLSTVVNKIGDRAIASTHTTPDPVSLNQLLAEMVEDGCSHCFMEVSSHAIHQHRITGLAFKGGVFTNITHDHLDYHKTFSEYIHVKKSFFDHLSKDAFALTNSDDKNGAKMLASTKAKKLTSFKDGYGKLFLSILIISLPLSFFISFKCSNSSIFTIAGLCVVKIICVLSTLDSSLKASISFL